MSLIHVVGQCIKKGKRVLVFFDCLLVKYAREGLGFSRIVVREGIHKLGTPRSRDSTVQYSTSISLTSGNIAILVSFEASG